jgi:RimJ/RimL family protein N-acetyltransferase
MSQVLRAIPILRRDGITVRLREATLADAPLIDGRNTDLAWQGDFNDFGPRERRLLADNLADGKRMVAPDRGQLVVERIADGENLGDVSWHTVRYGPNEESGALNIGIALVATARGRGHGTEAQQLLVGLLFEHFDINRVEASTDVENIAEQRSLEKAGFTREGILRGAQFRGGRYHDLVGYSILRADVAAGSEDPATGSGDASDDARTPT